MFQGLCILGDSPGASILAGTRVELAHAASLNRIEGMRDVVHHDISARRRTRPLDVNEVVFKLRDVRLLVHDAHGALQNFLWH